LGLFFTPLQLKLDGIQMQIRSCTTGFSPS